MNQLSNPLCNFVYLGEVVGEVEDVVDEVPRGWDLEVWDCPVVDDKAALLAVELEEALHPAVLGKLLLLRQRADHPLKNVMQRSA